MASCWLSCLFCGYLFGELNKSSFCSFQCLSLLFFTIWPNLISYNIMLDLLVSTFDSVIDKQRGCARERSCVFVKDTSISNRSYNVFANFSELFCSLFVSWLINISSWLKHTSVSSRSNNWSKAPSKINKNVYLEISL